MYSDVGCTLLENKKSNWPTLENTELIKIPITSWVAVISFQLQDLSSFFAIPAGTRSLKQGVIQVIERRCSIVICYWFWWLRERSKEWTNYVNGLIIKVSLVGLRSSLILVQSLKSRTQANRWVICISCEFRELPAFHQSQSCGLHSGNS